MEIATSRKYKLHCSKLQTHSNLETKFSIKSTTMNFAIVILGALCFSQVAFAQEDGRAGLDTISCVVKSIDGALKQAVDFPNTINACVGNAVGMPTDVVNMINDLVAKVTNVRTTIEDFQRASGLGKLTAAVKVVESVSAVLKTADEVVQRVNAVVNNDQAKECINKSIDNIKGSFQALQQC